MKQLKQLQKDYTTPEQSKRLLELGVPIDSSNMHISYSSNSCYSAPKFNDICVSAYRSYFPTLDILPCWTVGRLMEIVHICSDSTLSYEEEANEIQKFKEEHKCETLIEAVIECIADAVSIGNINFSKLEE